MGTFLFLEGKSGEGKTTLLFQCLSAYKKMIGGFYSQRLIDKAGLTVGFRMVSASEAWVPRLPYRDGLTNVFIERTGTGWKKRLDFFEKEGIDMLHSLKGRKLCLMDEIGGVELLSPDFMKAVLGCIDEEIPCIGVLKSRENFQSMSTRVPVKREADRQLGKLKDGLAGRPWGEILTFERHKEENIRTEIMRFLKDNVDEYKSGRMRWERGKSFLRDGLY